MIKLFEAEYKFMEILWKYAPINSTSLVRICEKELGWKKSTTYTTIKRLSDRNIVENINATVHYLVTKEDVRTYETKEHIEKLYEGSITKFFVSFLSKETLTTKEVSELKALIDNQSREGGQ